MRFHRETVSVEEAVAKLLEQVAPLAIEEVPLAEAYGRVLAEPVYAAYDLPPFDRSPLDGYAVRSADTASATPDTPVTLEVIETVAAGEVPRHPVASGQACRIMTGAMMPDGADAVVMFEQTENPGQKLNQVNVKRAMKPGENIARQGEEVAKDNCVLQAGEQIGAGALALLATFGAACVQVRRRPRIGIVSTGSELVEPDQPLSPGKIRNSNAPMIAGMICDAGGAPVVLGCLPDEPETAKRKLADWSKQVDFLVTTGGVSVGDFDLITTLVEDPQFNLLFHRVAMRPGSPTTAVVYQGTLICALSGNPSACFIGCELLVKPLLAKLLGKPNSIPTTVEAILAKDYLKPCPYPRYLRGSIEVEQAVLYAYPDMNDKAGRLVTLHQNNCLIIIPPGGRGRRAGERVRVFPLTKNGQFCF
ncbi:molybdopterin molybdotransferase MoeA [Brevibacillus humidisoli]|uniref:molybdopterin molybdotransferase MoeA n=1 Tax=Brevibacillus humidisoli TaxID=2895522 RepID=UPI001E3EDC83|nr:gephyrin-like molybdotransferase Glp [Brevibacillus humidisoli]UFJ42109.1 molybdopterin molybdotransferase MoeA [Brevibacillus humidisoli]